MAIAFSDIVGGPGSLPSSLIFSPGIGITAVPNYPAITPGQGLMIQSWMATSNSLSGGKLSQAEIGRLVKVWADNLGCSMPQIYAYAAANL
jgi:hypothetical protein